MPDTKASILIVDDRPEKLLALEAVLEDLNQTIVRAYSGREALRHILNQDFAVILLDVNMPGMDGFETASLIRQRSSSRHTPIIFITAFGDEMHASRGYSLGAVDYILAPVLPAVLRTKVMVFVELFIKTQQTQRQAESLRRRAIQLQKLAAASLAINSALTIERILATLTQNARDIIGAHQAVTVYMPDGPSGPAASRIKPIAAGSFSDKYVQWCDRELRLTGVAADVLMARVRSAATRLTDAELVDDPDWEALRKCDLPAPSGGVLAAPLTARDGGNLGAIYLSDRNDGEFFTHDDEAVLVQLVQMGSIAIENTIYAQEREANRIKDEFLATLSHELRTPLNAILGWTQLLKGDAVVPDVCHGLEVIERNARAQTKLIEDLLDVSRITTGKLRLNLKRSTFAPIVQAAVDTVRPNAEAKQLSLDVSMADDEIPISLDPDRVLQVVLNLLNNAVKFTPHGGRVGVQLMRSGPPGGERVTLAVSDSGQGIDPKFLPFVFDRFRQADSTSTRSQGGLGIGLTIVRHIVEQHGGTVKADSAGTGLGSTFTVELPAMGQVPATLTTTAGGNGAAATPTVHPVNGVRVLVVDDDADARDMIAVMLRRAGAQVTTVSSASEAMDTLPVDRPDVLVSDIAMPDEDGYSLIRQIRRLRVEDGGETPAIALTAYAREEDRARAIAEGFQSHLAKPVDPRDLLARVAHFSGRGAALKLG
jgi:signal transduction histidine kinase/DNA-binding response OmpR family regulator